MRLTFFLFLVLAACATSPTAQGQTGVASPAVADLLSRGAQAIHAGKPAEADAFFRQAIADAPDLADGYMGLGMSQLRQGHFDEAEVSLAKAIQISPAAAGPHLFLGIAQFQMNKLDAAAESLTQETALQPHNPEALTWLGIIQLAAGRPNRATAPLDEAAELSPSDPNILDYRARAHTLVAQQCYQKLYDMDPASWHVHRAQGEMFSAAHQPEQAIAEFKVALVEQPRNADLYEAIGDEYQRTGHITDAINAYTSELSLNPHSAVALFNLGKLHIENEDPATGITQMRQALAMHIAPAPAAYYLGSGLSKMGQYNEAAEWLEKAIADHPSDLIAQNSWYALMRVYQRLNRTADAERALSEFKRLKDASSKPAPQTP